MTVGVRRTVVPRHSEIDVEGVFTQSASLVEVPDQVRDAVGLMLGIDGADVDVDVRPVESRAG